MEAVRGAVGGCQARCHEGLCRHLAAEHPDVATVGGLRPVEGVGPGRLEVEKRQDVGQRFGHATDHLR